MIVGKAIYYLLTNATGVTDIVSTRVYPEVAQQDAALPYIVYNVTNNEPTDTKPEPSKLDTAQVEVNVYSNSYTEAIDLAVAVRAALDRVKGTYNGVNVQSIQYLNEIIDFDEPQRAYNINADYDVRISRSGFEIAQGSPITGVELGELSDVNVAGVTGGQVLAYDDATGNWIPANDGGAIALDDLTDVDAGEPEAGQLLSYGQGGWTTIAQDELEVPIGSVTGLQAALDATPDALDDLTDVKIVGTPTDGDALVYSSGFWARGTAGASTLGDLSDVNLTTPSTGAYLQYDGANWIDSVITLPSVPSTYYHNRYATEAETLRAGATATVELYYTAQADGDGYAESASSDTATAGFDIRRKLYYSEAAQADPDTGTWVQFADIADDTTFASAKATLLAYLKERTGGTVPISLKMTWEEVAESVTPLLDTYTGAAAAYSLRKLRTGETQAVRVRRASDNTEQDIGFDGSGGLDTTSLASFCSGTDGFVVTWYDQSGNNNDATQSTNGSQAKIYDSATGVLLENSKPCMDFASSKFMALSSAAISDLSSTAASVFMVCTPPDTTTDGVAYTLTDTAATSNVLSLSFNRTTGVYVVTRYTPTATRSGDTHGVNQSIFSFVSTGASNATGYEDGTQATTTPTTSRGNFDNAIGSNSAATASATFEGTIQELVIYASNPSRTGVESNLATFYGITL